METTKTDDTATVAAIGLLAYVSADLAHHALGHGGACLALGGSINLLSSVFVSCSVRGSAIDLAGPLMNLVVGLLALVLVRTGSHPAMRLFWILSATFNLLWFEGQMFVNVAARTDDWEWPLREFHVGDPARYGLVAVGIVAYSLTVRAIASRLAVFAHPVGRVRRIVVIAWLTAGAIAAATAAFDHHPVHALMQQALPQSVIVSLGLLFVPQRVSHLARETTAPMIERSTGWIAVACLTAIASLILLGPGVTALSPAQ